MENFQAEGRTQYRLFEYDFIRVVAMVFVIAVHALVVVSAHIFRKKRTFSVNAWCLHKIIQKKAG